MLEPFEIPAPFGPLNNRDNQVSLGRTMPGALVDILNLDYYQGGLKTRDGYTTYSGVLTAGKPVLHQYPFTKKDGTKLLLAVCGATIFKEGATPGAFVSVKTPITDGALWDFATIVDLCVGMDGVAVDAFKYDGTTQYPLAITAPTAAPATALAGAGVLTGSYQYKVTFVSKWGAETNATQASAPLTASAHAIQVSSIPVGGADVGKRRLYRTAAGGSLFFRLATINDNATTTYSDNAPDADLGTEPEPIDHDPPPNGEILWVWKEYVWTVDPANRTRGYHSHQSYPEIFHTDEVLGFYVSVGLNDGEDIIGMRGSQNTLYWFKENSTWPMTGDVPDDFRLPPNPINSAIGLYHRSIADLPDGRWIGLHRSGVYVFDGYRFEKVSDRDLDSIQAVIDDLNPARLKAARGFYDATLNRYSLDVTMSGFAYHNKRLVFDRLRDRWTIYDLKANGTVRWNNQLLFGSSQGDGYIHQIGGLNDAGAAISVSAEWPWWSLWDPQVLKLVKFLQVALSQEGTYQPAFTVYFNSRSRVYSVWLDEGKDWGSGAWVVEGGTYQITRMLSVNQKHVEHLKVKFSHNGLNQPVTLRAMTVFGAPSGRLVA